MNLFYWYLVIGYYSVTDHRSGLHGDQVRLFCASVLYSQKPTDRKPQETLQKVGLMTGSAV